MEFETLYKKARKNLVKNKIQINDKSLYVEFMSLLHRLFYDDDTHVVNTWIIEQNSNKTIYNGKEHIKQICLGKFYEAQAESS